MKIQPLLRLMRFLGWHRWRIAGAWVLGTGTILAGIGLLASSGYLISAAALRPPILDLLVVIVSVRFFGISRAVLRYGERLLSHDITFRLLMRMRSRFFASIQALPASRLLGYRSGNLLSSVTSDIDELQNFYVRVITPFTVAFISSVIAFLFIRLFSPSAAWVTLGLLSVNGAFVPLLLRRLARGIGTSQVRLRSRLYRLWIEMTQGIQDIRLYNLQKAYNEQYNNLCERIDRAERRQSVFTGLQDALLQWTMFGAVIVSLVVTAPVVLSGELEGVMMALVIFSVMAAFESTQNLGSAFQYLESTEKAADNLFSLESGERPHTRNKTDGGKIFDSINRTAYSDNLNIALKSKVKTRAINRDPDILFEKVDFAYGRHQVLNGIGFPMETGSKTAVVGPSGSGKSTLLNLLLRFYDPDAGQIRVGGRNSMYWHPEDIRAAISVVDQSTYLFNDTLRENLLLAHHGADDHMLLQALQDAHLMEWYNMLPNGLDTYLGEHGKQLSGGERQRLAVCRALLKNAPVWILDEPTANLDTITEKSLVQTIRKALEGRTALWITHRLVQMDYFDRILVLEEGRITARGRHHVLIKKEGWYRDMMHLQSNLLADRV
ncbi:MAG: thiol reductant ABC exporter subunit CydC [Cyclonatronaceae bacterium]